MKNRKIFSLMLALVMVLSTFSTVFADRGDLTNLDGTVAAEFAVWTVDGDVFPVITIEADKYEIEVNGKKYNLKEVMDLVGGGKTLDEAAAELDAEVPAELTVVSVSAINATTLAVVMSDGSPKVGEVKGNRKLTLNKLNDDVLFEVDGVIYVEDVLYTMESSYWEEKIEEYHEVWIDSKERGNLATQRVVDAAKKATWADRYGDDKQKLEAARVLLNATADEVIALADLALDTANLAGSIFQSYQALQYEEALELVKLAESIPDKNVAVKQVAHDNAEEFILKLQDGNIGGGNLTPEYDDLDDLLEELLLTPGGDKIPEWRLAWDDSDDRIADLENRLEVVQAIIYAVEAVSDLEEFVAEEGFNFIQARDDYENAKELVDDLEDGTVKDALLARLESAKEIIDDAITSYLENEATEAVEDAEEWADKTGGQDWYDTAKDLVDELEDGDVKTALLARLEAVQEIIDQIVEDIAAAAAVDALIAPLPAAAALTIANKAAVEEAVEAYEQLTEIQKELLIPTFEDFLLEVKEQMEALVAAQDVLDGVVIGPVVNATGTSPVIQLPAVPAGFTWKVLGGATEVEINPAQNEAVVDNSGAAISITLRLQKDVNGTKVNKFWTVTIPGSPGEVKVTVAP